MYVAQCQSPLVRDRQVSMATHRSVIAKHTEQCPAPVSFWVTLPKTYAAFLSKNAIRHKEGKNNEFTSNEEVK